jgi:hypothetical protein
LTIAAIDASHLCGGKQMVMNRTRSSNQPATQLVLMAICAHLFSPCRLFLHQNVSQCLVGLFDVKRVT